MENKMFPTYIAEKIFYNFERQACTLRNESDIVVKRCKTVRVYNTVFFTMAYLIILPAEIKAVIIFLYLKYIKK